MKTGVELYHSYQQNMDRIKDEKPQKVEHEMPSHFASVSTKISLKLNKAKQEVLNFFKSIENYFSAKFRDPAEVEKNFLKDLKSLVKANEKAFNELKEGASTTIRMELPKNKHGYTEDFVIKLQKTKDGLTVSTTVKLEKGENTINIDFSSYAEFANEFHVKLKPEHTKKIIPSIVEKPVHENTRIDQRNEIKLKMDKIIEKIGTYASKKELQQDVEILISELKNLNPEIALHFATRKQYETIAKPQLDKFINNDGITTFSSPIRNPEQLKADAIILSQLFQLRDSEIIK